MNLPHDPSLDLRLDARIAAANLLPIKWPILNTAATNPPVIPRVESNNIGGMAR